MKKVNVDESICIGCGFCCASKPEVFEMNDDGIAFVNENEEVTEEIIEISEGCPVGAIKINED